MHVSTLVWGVTLAGLLLILLLDLLIVGRRPHEPSMKEATGWVIFYVALACGFGAMIWAGYGHRYGQEFFAGWLTEYSLSVDNLFVFVIIMHRFMVPRIFQQKVLLIGIVIALVMRGIFIALGAALVSRFVAVFYLFGLFLIYTAWQLTRQGETDESDFKENIIIRWSRRVLPVSKSYNGGKLHIRSSTGKFLFTPMFIVMIAIGTTDLIFALDSIPAIFGLTKEPYLVFTANVFALMGLRQLYFLLGGLLERLVYLSLGLAAILGFIGVKLILEAMAGNNLPFINGGEPIHGVPHISIGWSLGVIVSILAIATVASLIKSSRDARREALAGNPSTGNPSGSSPSTGNPSGSSPSTGNPSGSSPSGSNPSGSSPSGSNPSAGNRSTGNPSTGNPADGLAGGGPAVLDPAGKPSKPSAPQKQPSGPGPGPSTKGPTAER